MRSPLRRNEGYLELEDITPCGASASAIDEYALKVLTTAGLLALPVAVEALVEKFGGRITILPLDEWCRGEYEPAGIMVHGPKNFDIRMANNLGLTQRRFWIAHKFGHYFLHARQGERRIQLPSAGNDNEIEREANQFAFGLLMPAKIFLAELDQYNGNRKENAGSVGVARFHVSAENAESRYKQLTT